MQGGRSPPPLLTELQPTCAACKLALAAARPHPPTRFVSLSGCGGGGGASAGGSMSTGCST